MAATIGTRLHTWFKGRFIGKDEYGNRYYAERSKPTPGQRQKRWVIFNGRAEPSKVPPEWHGWLHYTSDVVPESSHAKRFRWQKPHTPNLTGTKHRYLPQGHMLVGGERAKATGDYEAWTPGE